MTYSDIFTKFMIEYDKANLTSSYPSLTNYEIATLLDKAYLALINQKVTGNNVRKIPFEGDGKAIDDLQELIKTETITSSTDIQDLANNELVFKIDDLDGDYLYYVSSIFKNGDTTYSVILMNHNIAEKYKEVVNNKPTLKSAIAYLLNGYIHVLHDSYITISDNKTLLLTYIKRPIKFIPYDENVQKSTFELSDYMAEELINLAIVFALETIESTRLLSKTQLTQLEA